MKKDKLKRIGFYFLTLFLLFFMLLIFGPAEIFFANTAGFDFVYGEFAGYLAIAALIVTGIGAVILAFLPQKFSKLILSVVFGISISGYLQVMFLNKQLDLLGQNPEGYQADMGQVIPNLIIWLVIIGAVIVIAYWKEEIWKKILTYASLFLVAIQGVALVSLLLTAGEDAYKHEEGAWYLSGENQFVVSAHENVIVLVLDYFSNQYIEMTREKYPDMIDFLNDFTYYNNANADYFGTFPSMTSTFAGVDFNPKLLINDWFYQSWTNDKTIGYYNELKELGYTCNMFTTGDEYFCGTNDRVMLKGVFDNVVNTSNEIDVFYKLLFKTITKMSCYRFMPEVAKTAFYTTESEYKDIIGYETNEILHSNYKFYDKLITEGLTVDDSSNYFVVQHLSGGHEFNHDENCLYSEDVEYVDTYKGAMVMVEEYLNQLKELGLYDDATIIVTSDHGGPTDPQMIFFIKEANETHDEMRVTNAPITLRELLPTIAKSVGANYEQYGKTIYDFSENEQRERVLWERGTSNKFPALMNYSNTQYGLENVFVVYKYTGDYDDLLEQIIAGNYEIVQMLDSFYVN